MGKQGDGEGARIWFNGDVPPAVAQYIRTIFVRCVEGGDLSSAWDVLSVMYDLESEPPSSFENAKRDAKSRPDVAVRILSDWARRQAKPSTFGEFTVVQPNADRVSHWLKRRIERPEYASIFAEDIETLLVLAQAADIAETTAAWRVREPARLPLPVLLFGETGTGKELLARAMHGIHMRALIKNAGWNDSHVEESFGPINCGGLPPNLIESELFGHVRGAFTGASKSRKGIIVEHSRGTVFLDEIGDTPAEVQLRLLRFLNDGEVRAVGANRPTYQYPWVIGATHRDLGKHVAEGRFREDLFNRLNGHMLALKPLRLRGGDVVGAFNACIERHAGTKLTVSLSVAAEFAIRTNSWGANLRLVDQLARRLVKERSSVSHLRVDIGDLSPEFQAQYFTSVPYATRLLHDYSEERETLSSEERAAHRSALLLHYRSAIEQGLVPDVRFIRSAAKLAASSIVRKLVDDDALHERIIATAGALAERTMQRHQRQLERELFAADGLAAPVRDEPIEIMSTLPIWVRRAFLIVEELSLSPEAWDQIRKLEMVLERFTPSLRVALSDLFAAFVEDVRRDEPAAATVDVPTLHTWKAVRDDAVLFEQELKTAGSAAQMAQRFEKNEKTVRDRARQLGIKLPNKRKETNGRKNTRKNTR